MLRCQRQSSNRRGPAKTETEDAQLVSVKKVLQVGKVRAVRSNDYQTKVGKVKGVAQLGVDEEGTVKTAEKSRVSQ